MAKPTLAWICSSLGYLSHFRPLWEDLPEFDHFVLTNFRDTGRYVKDVLGMDCFQSGGDDQLWKAIKDRGIKNVILNHQKISQRPDPRELNMIQVYHGVSFKSVLSNWHPVKWTHCCVQGVHYWTPYTKKFPDEVDRMHQTQFTRAKYYKEPREWDRSGYVLYMPTHNDKGYTSILENLRVISKTNLDIVVKLHPINHRNQEFMGQIRKIRDRFPQVSFIEPNCLEYVDYHKLFEGSSLMISDFSSVACEYTLTDKPLVIQRGHPGRKTVGGRDFGHLKPHLFEVEGKDTTGAVIKALESFKRGSYPKLYYGDEAPPLAAKIKELLV